MVALPFCSTVTAAMWSSNPRDCCETGIYRVLFFEILVVCRWVLEVSSVYWWWIQMHNHIDVLCRFRTWVSWVSTWFGGERRLMGAWTAGLHVSVYRIKHHESFSFCRGLHVSVAWDTIYLSVFFWFIHCPCYLRRNNYFFVMPQSRQSKHLVFNWIVC
jgi:hypothetical protein